MNGKEFCIKNLGKNCDLTNSLIYSNAMIVGYVEDLDIVILSYTSEIGWQNTNYPFDVFLISSPLCQSYWLANVKEVIIKE